MLLIQTVATFMNGMQYLFLGACSGLAMNILGIARNLIYSNKEKSKICAAKWMPCAFAALMAGVSIFMWEAYYSIFIILGIMINTVCLGVFDSQHIRWSILISCPLIFIYNAFTGAYPGMLNESISPVSAIVGIIRYRRAKKEGKTA